MYRTISSKLPRDKDLPARAFELSTLTKVLKGCFYDHLPYEFSREKGDNGEYVPLRERRPSVKSNLCRIVVDDLVGLLFSEGHFPDVQCLDEDGKTLEPVKKIVDKLIKDTRLKQVMVDAATKGSVGSVAVRMRVLENRVFFDAMESTYLTPYWSASAPDTLERVVEKYKVLGMDLDESYKIPAELGKTPFWFMREWTGSEEVWYRPWLVFAPTRLRSESLRTLAGQQPVTPVRDEGRSVKHNLGFVPMVWIRNLPGGDEIDGFSSFQLAADTVIEIDYLLSQAGRGLKYMSDPTLLIKEDDRQGEDGKIVKGSANALTVGTQGDAKLLEINGTGAHAVITFVRLLRETALEAMHGNRTSAEKVNVAQSGRAMEMMNQALVGVADKLRTPYGEEALVELLRMVFKASELFQLTFKDGKPVGKVADDLILALRWPSWYAPTAQDRMQIANALKIHTDAGHLSQETALRTIASDYDVENPDTEKGLIDTEMAKKLKDAQVLATISP